MGIRFGTIGLGEDETSHGRHKSIDRDSAGLRPIDGDTDTGSSHIELPHTLSKGPEAPIVYITLGASFICFRLILLSPARCLRNLP